MLRFTMLQASWIDGIVIYLWIFRGASVRLGHQAEFPQEIRNAHQDDQRYQTS